MPAPAARVLPGSRALPAARILPGTRGALPVLLLPLLVVLLAGPAGASPVVEDEADADLGFPIAIVLLIVLGTVLALVWRQVSKRRSDRR